MGKLLTLLCGLLLSCSVHAQGMGPGPGVKGYASAITISPDKSWVNFTTASGATTLASNAIQPADGALVVVVAAVDQNKTASVTADTFSDTGCTGTCTWQTAVSINATSGALGQFYIFWRNVGTSSASGTVTITASAASYIEVSVGSYAKSGGTWGTDGSNSANDITNNFGTTITSNTFTTTMTNGLLVGYSSNGTGQVTYPATLTKQKFTNANNSDAVIDNNIAGTITATAGTNAVASDSGLSNRFFAGLGAAFKAE